MTTCRVSFLVLALAILVPAIAYASMSPATWVTQRVLGVVQDGVVLLHLRRHVASYYAYEAAQELRVVSNEGCVSTRIALQASTGRDTDTLGNWETKVVRGENVGAAAELLATMSPVVPRDRQSVILREGALWIGHDGDWYEIVSAERVVRWSAMAGQEMAVDGAGELAIAGLWQSIHALQDRGLTYVEIVPDGAEIDIDRTAFVVPVDDRGARRLLESGVKDKAALARSQPDPSGC